MDDEVNEMSQIGVGGGSEWKFALWHDGNTGILRTSSLGDDINGLDWYKQNTRQL